MRVYCCNCTTISNSGTERDTIDAYEIGGGKIVWKCHGCGAAFAFISFGDKDPHASVVHQTCDGWDRKHGEPSA